jgi:hypothetical protein
MVQLADQGDALVVCPGHGKETTMADDEARKQGTGTWQR